MPLHVSSTSAHRQDAKIVLYILWYHHTYRWPSCAQIERGILASWRWALVLETCWGMKYSL